MSIHKWNNWVRVVVFGLFASAALPQSQAPPNPPADTPPKQSPEAKADKKRLLEEATRVSTSEAAKSVAREQTAKPAASQASEEPASGSEVMELQPAAQSSAATQTVIAGSGDSKKSVTKNVHGTVYGSADPRGRGNRTTGGAVGASSKSGKTSVYVETDQGRSTSSSPH